MNHQLEMMNEMMGDDRGDMSTVKMQEHMQLMKIMNVRLDMIKMAMKQAMERQDQDDNLDRHHDNWACLDHSNRIGIQRCLIRQ